jgi:NADPH:quinone reductase
MKAILIKQKGGVENLLLAEYEKPKPADGFVLIQIKAFGLNRAEVYMRKGEWAETTNIIGIECVGVVEDDPSGELKPGQQVAAFVGGMARSINGSYAEYILLPKSNVMPFKSNLPWNELAAIPESYATAWAILHWGLDAKPGEKLFVRGGTSTLGMACIILGNQLGMQVMATSRSANKMALLKEMGAITTYLDDDLIARNLLIDHPEGVDKLVELIGTSTLQNSFGLVRPRGAICMAGFLGGLNPIENFQPIFQIPNSIKLSTFASAFSFGQKGFEFSQIPLQQIISNIEEKKIPNILRKTFNAVNIREAHSLLESNDANGKIVAAW